MGRNESTVELLVKVWEGIREFLEVPNESTGFFFRHMRVLPASNDTQLGIIIIALLLALDDFLNTSSSNVLKVSFVKTKCYICPL